MDGKILAYILLLLAFVGLVYGVHYTMEVDEAAAQLAGYQQDLSSTENQIEMQSSFLARKQNMAALVAEIESLKARKAEMDEEIRNCQSSYEDGKKKFVETIEKVRRNAPGLSFPQLVLANGKSLQKVVLQKVEESLVTLAHSDGVVRVEPRHLPPELQEKFGFHLAHRPPASPEPVSAKSSQPPAAAPKEAAPPKVLSEREKNLELAKLQKRKLENELPHIQSQIDSSRMEAENFQTSPSRKYYAKTRLAALEQQLISTKRAIDNLDLQIHALQSPLTK